MSERAPIQDVNIEFGDDVSRMLYEASKLTHENRPGLLEEVHESFSGFRGVPLGKLADITNLTSNLGFDGVGTKVEIAERIKDHSTVAFDLFAMVCDDAVVRGAEPLTIGSILDVNQLDDSDYTHKSIEQLASGYVNAARAAGVVVVNGEVAELGDRIGGHGEFNYNWGAAVWWVAHNERTLTGKEIKPGDALVGLAEHGFRSNGITDVRKAMLENYGSEWQQQVASELGQLSLGELVRKPSTIYTKFINKLTGGYHIGVDPEAKITGVAHITGGGQPSKLARMLEPSGHGATIDDPIEPPAIMKHVQELRDFTDKKAYGKWHMGPGMVVATPEPEKVLALAPDFGIDAKQIGYVTDDPMIKIKNRGVQQQKEWLIF
jgi:phosphoribosylformylglycinamidine cyclo-ligase